MLGAGAARDRIDDRGAQLVDAFPGQRGSFEDFNPVGTYLTRSEITLVRDHQRARGAAGLDQVVIVFRQRARAVYDNEDQISLAKSFVGLTNTDALRFVGGVAYACRINQLQRDAAQGNG